MSNDVPPAAAVTVGEVVDFLEKVAPLRLAAEWDNVGLLLGDRAAEIRRLMTCLTVTPDVVAEAIEAGAGLIVTHHPILFRPIQRVTASTPEGRMVLDLIRGRVAVYSAHTAFDNSQEGINETLARRLNLLEVVPMRRRSGPRECKVVVFVPEADLGAVMDAMFAAGAGNIGPYSQCSFRLDGTGTFFGSETTHPAVGQKGRCEEVSEWRLEAICGEADVDGVIAAIRRFHSYEEPAYDVYPLRAKVSTTGEGRSGRLPRATPLRALATMVKAVVNARLVQIVGDPERNVERAAIVCGAGGEFLADAVDARSDVFLTGEMRFHDQLAARARGMALLLPGHYATERFGLEELASRLQNQWPGIEVWASRQEQDPAIPI